MSYRAGRRSRRPAARGLQAHATLSNRSRLDLDGNLLITDSSAHMVRRITPAGMIQRVSGTGVPGSGGDGGPATAAQDWTPWGVAVDPAGNSLIGDAGTSRVRMIDQSGTIHTLVQASATGLAADPAGYIWIAGAAPPFPLSLPQFPTVHPVLVAKGSRMRRPARGTPWRRARL